MSTFNDDAYEPGSPKRSDYTGPTVCALCAGRGGHYADCPEVVMSR